MLALCGLGLVQAGLVFLHLPGWPCAFRKVAGLPCPGCGLSRALVSLLRGDLRAALAIHAFAPLLAATGLLLAGATLMRAPARARLAARLAAFESRTGLGLWLAAAFLVYWAFRLLYYPHTLTPPG